MNACASFFSGALPPHARAGEPTRAYAKAPMLVPVCCFSCNCRIGNVWAAYLHAIDSGHTAAEALGMCGVSRQCCRRMLLSNVDLNSLFEEHETHGVWGKGVEIQRSSDAVRTIEL